MNTVEKGDLFENLSYNIINDNLSQGKLGLIPAYCRVFQKKGYYSASRLSDIIFDISIEVWLPGADTYSLLYLIECKNYSTNVPVNKIEDFHSKIQQVSGVNVKGIFITNSPLQEGGYNFAKSKGMMVIEVNDNISYSIILHKAKRHQEKQFEKFDLPTKESIHSEAKLRRLIEKLLLEGFTNHVKKLSLSTRGLVQKMSTERIEELTRHLLNYFDSTIISNHKRLPLEQFFVFLKDTYGLKIIFEDFTEYDLHGREIISDCSFADKLIRIKHTQENPRRNSFLVCHEIGHFFLHNKLQINQDAYEKMEDSKFSFFLDRYLLENERDWIEWQANKFAAYLLLPKEPIIYQLCYFQKLVGLKGGHPIFVDEQPCNQKDFHNVTGLLASYFGTTKTTIIYRLNSLNLITFKYKTKTLGQVIQEIMGTHL